MARAHGVLGAVEAKFLRKGSKWLQNALKTPFLSLIGALRISSLGLWLWECSKHAIISGAVKGISKIVVLYDFIDGSILPVKIR